jgi:hypothetical protein
MAALVIVIATAAVFAILFGGFIVICGGIRHVDKHGTLQKAPTLLSHLTGAHAARFDTPHYI